MMYNFDRSKSKKTSGNNSAAQLHAVKKNDTGLPDALKSGIESLSGFDMQNVNVHYNSSKPAQLRSHAYTQGTEIYVAPGQERHLPHEAWHVVQQMQGRVKPTVNIGGEPVNDSAELEHEADVMGEKAAGTEGMGERALQLKKCMDRVSQLSNIRNVTPKTYNTPMLVPSEKPTIVFESMSSKIEDAEEIYKQTQDYDGNTICVFGMNREYKPGTTPLKPVQVNEVQPHFYRGFAFEWTRPAQANANAQYKMPFIEARLEVMSQAEKIVKKIIPASNQAQPSVSIDRSDKFVYRWIDGDAREDKSNEIPVDVLSNLSSETYWVLTGSYSWATSLSKDKCPTYCAFIDKVNEGEYIVRKKYFEVHGKLADSLNTTSKLPEFLNGGNLGSYYLPETTMMFSPQQHNIMLTKIRTLQLVSDILTSNAKGLNDILKKYDENELESSAKEIIGNVKVLGFNKMKDELSRKYGQYVQEFQQGNIQDKESMKMLTYVDAPSNLIFFEPKLKTTKPLKGELNRKSARKPSMQSNGTNVLNYLGEKMLKLLLGEKTVANSTEFRKRLFDMRQSVFERFMDGDQGFKDTVDGQIRDIYGFYNYNKEKIKSELEKALRVAKGHKNGGK